VSIVALRADVEGNVKRSLGRLEETQREAVGESSADVVSVQQAGGGAHEADVLGNLAVIQWGVGATLEQQAAADQGEAAGGGLQVAQAEGDARMPIGAVLLLRPRHGHRQQHQETRQRTTHLVVSDDRKRLAADVRCAHYVSVIPNVGHARRQHRVSERARCLLERNETETTRS
jgi:hypothetical protein